MKSRRWRGGIEKYMTKKHKDIEKILIDFFQKMGIDIDSEAKKNEDALRINIKPKDEKLTSLLIGYRGENLFSIQHLVRMLLRRRTGESIKILLDINDYRERHSESLKEMALSLAERVKRTQRVELLRPMTAYERRIVHIAIREIGGLMTQSVGEEPNRRVIIKPGESN